ncbi:MAG: microcystin-dependent protein [Arenicella sp.]|jgi:microcystin-dependent protein
MEGYLAEVRCFALNFTPRGWMSCDGQLVAISNNIALFSLIGTIYGGDGRTTFGLPDLRGRSPLGAGGGPGLQSYNQGARASGNLIPAEGTSHEHGVLAMNWCICVDGTFPSSA